jgi:hypothetical protein
MSADSLATSTASSTVRHERNARSLHLVAVAWVIRTQRVGELVAGCRFMALAERLGDYAVYWVGPRQFGERHWLAGSNPMASRAAHWSMGELAGLLELRCPASLMHRIRLTLLRLRS